MSIFKLSIWGLSAAAAVSLAAATAPATMAITAAHHLLEPRLTIAKTAGASPAVALTFDACMGKIDRRILDMLLREKFPATIFVTARWIRSNPETFAIFRDNPDQFEIEDHGTNHVPAVERPVSIYGIRAAGSPEAVAAEVSGGADAIVHAGAAPPVWFRGATAKYSARSIAQIEAMGYRIAGFSINGDGGALLGDKETARRIAAALDGDVIIAHINQPDRKAGLGVVAGVMDLKTRGYRFVLLRDQTSTTMTAGR